MNTVKSSSERNTVKSFSKLFTTILLTCLIATLTIQPILAQYKPPHSKPGPAVDKISFRQFAVEIAPAAMESKQMDLYSYALKMSAAKDMSNKPGIEVYRAPATTISIILNPAPAAADELNPFAIREVRFALQYLLNREFIVSQIYQGLAASMTTLISPFDYDYLTVYDLVKKFNIHYDADLGKSIVDGAMTKAGAVKKDSVWTYKDKPIILKFIIRVEDERRDIGDAFATDLDKIGFKVERIYQQFGPAIQKVYGSDPKLFEWHLYTEGWSKGSTQKYDYATLSQMAAPWFGNMPGWQESGFYQYENATIDTLSKKIFTGDFKDIQERNALYRQATEVSLSESVRLWVGNMLNSYPTTSDLNGVTNDLASGPRSIWTLREAYVPNKSELIVGNLWVWTERTIWNPVGGFGDVYSIDIWQNVNDPPTWTHPFTGLPIPFRSTFKVETNGPTGKVNIPSDAFMWDAVGGKWNNVNTGSQSISKVTFDYSKYIGTNWHDGQPITMADIIYSIYQSFDMTYNKDKSKIEFAKAAVTKPYLDTYKGFRIVDDKTLEVYLDYWHFVPDYIAQYAQPTGLSMPWEILASMDNLVFEKRKAAYSDTAAGKYQVPWLSLVMEKDARLVRNVLSEFSRTGFTPKSVFTVGGKSLVDQSEAVKRYDSAVAWFDKYNILVISNGPFMLTKFEPQSQFAQIDAFRDSSYPFKPGDWYFGKAQLVEISNVESTSIKVGEAAKYSVDVTGPGEIGVKYVLFDSAKGEVLASGDSTRESASKLSISLQSSVTSKMVNGAAYRLYLAAYSDKIAYVTERIENINVGSQVTSTSKTTSSSSKTTSSTISTISSSTTITTGTSVEETGLSPLLIVAAIVIPLLIIIPAVLLRRKGAGKTS